MNRLTTRIEGVAAQAWEHEEQHTPAEWIDLLQERLAAYEDTGLEPEELAEILEQYKGFKSAISDENNVPQVSWGRASELCRADKEGRVVVLPCKPGEYWRDQNGDRVRIETVSFCRSRRLLCDNHMVTYTYEDEGDDFAANWIYFCGHFTREAAENLEGGGDHE